MYRTYGIRAMQKQLPRSNYRRILRLVGTHGLARSFTIVQDDSSVGRDKYFSFPALVKVSKWLHFKSGFLVNKYHCQQRAVCWPAQLVLQNKMRFIWN